VYIVAYGRLQACSLIEARADKLGQHEDWRLFGHFCVLADDFFLLRKQCVS